MPVESGTTASSGLLAPAWRPRPFAVQHRAIRAAHPAERRMLAEQLRASTARVSCPPRSMRCRRRVITISLWPVEGRVVARPELGGAPHVTRCNPRHGQVSSPSKEKAPPSQTNWHAPSGLSGPGDGGALHLAAHRTGQAGLPHQPLDRAPDDRDPPPGSTSRRDSLSAAAGHRESLPTVALDQLGDHGQFIVRRPGSTRHPERCTLRRLILPMAREPPVSRSSRPSIPSGVRAIYAVLTTVPRVRQSQSDSG